VTQRKRQDLTNFLGESIVVVKEMFVDIYSIIDHPNFAAQLCPQYTKDRFINFLNVAMTVRGMGGSMLREMKSKVGIER